MSHMHRRIVSCRWFRAAIVPSVLLHAGACAAGALSPSAEPRAWAWSPRHAEGAPRHGAEASAGATGQPPAAEGAPGPAGGRDAAASAGEIRSADDLLLALERADASLRTLSAGVQYARKFPEIQGGDTQTWRGTLYFDSPPAAETAPADGTAAADGTATRSPRRFAVIFDVLFVDGARRDEPKHYIFDGAWFVERIAAERLFIARRVVRPGQQADPLRLGEGPFPIPIGQRRDDILARFTAELLPPEAGWPDENFPALMRDTWQLRLVPRPGTDEAAELSEVRLWYRREDLLPRMARTITPEGSQGSVLLINHRVNGEINPAVFDTEPPPPEAGWDVQIEEWRGGEPAPAPGPVEPPAATPEAGEGR